MPPTISRTFSQLRQQISRAFGDLITFTAASGSTTQVTGTGEVAGIAAGRLVGAELSSISGTGLGQSVRVTAHTVTGGTATLTFPTATAMSSDTVVELHGLYGQVFTKGQYDDAIYSAVDMMADQVFTDTDVITLACERGYGGGQIQGLRRSEYPFPSASFNWLWGVDLQAQGPLTKQPTGYLKTFRALGDAAARTRLAQGFQVQQDSLVGYISFWLNTVGAPTDNLSVVVETNAAGIPSGTAVTNGTSATVAYSLLSGRTRYVVFTFDPPMFLTANTQYHATIKRSTGTDASNYYQIGEDNTGSYSYGDLSLYSGSVWSAVTGSDLIFAVSPASTRWLDLAAANWEYRPQSTDQLLLRKMGVEGTVIRLRGGAAIVRPTAETSVVAVRPDFVTAYAEALLRRNRAGTQSPDNNAQAADALTRALGLLPTPRRAQPANSVKIFGTS